jgi:hypothetical protein
MGIAQEFSPRRDTLLLLSVETRRRRLRRHAVYRVTINPSTHQPILVAQSSRNARSGWVRVLFTS